MGEFGGCRNSCPSVSRRRFWPATLRSLPARGAERHATRSHGAACRRGRRRGRPSSGSRPPIRAASTVARRGRGAP
eukprot:5945894-Pyramimonas_sp.AAC.1